MYAAQTVLSVRLRRRELRLERSASREQRQRADRTQIEIDFPTWKARCAAEADRHRQEAIQSADQKVAQLSKTEPG